MEDYDEEEEAIKEEEGETAASPRSLVLLSWCQSREEEERGRRQLRWT